jgi:L-fuculose-phosphate aldolase
MSYDELKAKICEIGARMYQRGYIDGYSGNITVKTNDGPILTSPSGVAKGFLQQHQILLVDEEGNCVDDQKPRQGLRPTSELSMHLECYRQRDDVQAVVHAHPPNAVALTIAGIELTQPLIPEMIVMLGVVPTAPYATPSSAENRDVIRSLVTDHDTIMLAHHGSVTVGRSLEEAYMRLEVLEHNATILSKVMTLGGPKRRLGPSDLSKLLRERETLGLLRDVDADTYLNGKKADNS